MSNIPPPPPPPPMTAESWQVANPNHVRKNLLRRIASGHICGQISKISGRPCLATPTKFGAPCQKHMNAEDFRTVKSRAGRMLTALIHDALSPEEARIFDQTFSESPTLETEIALARLKVVKLERDYAEGKLKDETYQKRWAALMDSLRKLVATNQKARLAEEQLRQLSTDPTKLPDAYDPLGADDETESEAEAESE